MKTYKNHFRTTLLFAVILLAGSCYPSQDLTVEELDIVSTIYDSDVNFSDYQTFLMPDTIIQIGDPEDPGFIDLPVDNMDEILDQIRSGFEDLGYVEEPDPANNEPDVAIIVEVVAQENYIIYSYPPGGWWGGWGWYPWPGWGWGPGYGPGYPGYGGVGVQSYPEGTLIVDMLDPNKVTTEEERISSVWIGIMNGLLYETNNPNRVPDGIDQMFTQSPYLRTN